MIKIIRPGLLTSIQDMGRTQGLAFGIPRSGVMDSHAHQLSNWLVGNALSTPVIEATMIAPSVEASCAMQLGIVGAYADVFVNGCVVDRDKTIFLNPRDQLRIGQFKQGCRLYIAVNGRFKVDTWLGSDSTYLPLGLGGFNGRQLQTGDCVDVELSEDKQLRCLSPSLRALPLSCQTLRVVLAPGFNCLPECNQQHFLECAYPIDANSNRMGYRLLAAEDKTFTPPSELTRVVVPGTIQCPSTKELIITLADGQTTGGYSQIAHVVSADLPLLGQLKPGDSVRFFPVSVSEAVDILKQKQNYIETELTKYS